MFWKQFARSAVHKFIINILVHAMYLIYLALRHFFAVSKLLLDKHVDFYIIDLNILCFYKSAAMLWMSIKPYKTLKIVSFGVV